MSKPNLLVVSPRDHYALRNLSQVKELADISISNDEGEIQHLGKDADILLHTSLTGKTVAFAKVWSHTRKVKWVHSLSAGVERVLIPAFRESPVPLTNARGVFKRSLAEFALLGMLYFSKHVRRLVESQRAHKWDDFSTEFIENKIMGIVGYGEVSVSATPLATPETVQTAWHVIHDFLAPRLKGQEIAAPGPISEVFAFVRGHERAKAAVEMAVLDLFG